MARSDRAQSGTIVDARLENYNLSEVPFGCNFCAKAQDTRKHSRIGKKYTYNQNGNSLFPN